MLEPCRDPWLFKMEGGINSIKMLRCLGLVFAVLVMPIENLNSLLESGIFLHLRCLQRYQRFLVSNCVC